MCGRSAGLQLSCTLVAPQFRRGEPAEVDGWHCLRSTMRGDWEPLSQISIDGLGDLGPSQQSAVVSWGLDDTQV